MKKILKILIVLLIFISTSANAQTTPAGCDPYNNTANTNDICEEGNDIKTDPANPVNDDSEELKNDFERRVKHTPGSSIPDEHYHAYDGYGVFRPVMCPKVSE